MTKKKIGLGVIAGGILGLALTFGNGATSQQVEMWRKVGQTIYPVPSTISVSVQEFTQGGGIRATSTVNSAETLLVSDMLNYNVIDYTPNVENMTLTLPATSTMTALLPTAGDMRTWVLRNATTSAITITVATGAGIDLQEPDGQNVVISNTNFAWLTCYRKANTDVVCLVDESIPAD